MFNRYKNKIFIFSMFCALVCLPISFAQASLGDWDSELDSGASNTNVYETNDDGTSTDKRLVTFISGIFVLAPFLGTLFILRIIIGGYEWMTAGGNSEKIETAKKRMKNATIGIFIFATLYFIAYFFVTNLARIAGYNI